MKRCIQLSLIAAAVAGVCATPAFAADGEWQHTVVIYGMGAAIDGEGQIGSLIVPVDVSISDVFDALEMGAMAAYRADNGTWSVTLDATFMGLGGTQTTQRGLVKGDMDVDQTAIVATVGRRLTPNIEALFSLSYFDLSADLALTTRNPVTGAATTRSASTDASWVDPMLGLQFNAPIADGWRASLRTDVGGFGIGSDFSYQVLANLRWEPNEKVGVIFGYRVIDFDYEDDDGSPYQRFDLTEQGPLVGVTYTF
jgi:opacity protein-like surface antigen